MTNKPAAAPTPGEPPRMTISDTVTLRQLPGSADGWTSDPLPAAQPAKHEICEKCGDSKVVVKRVPCQCAAQPAKGASIPEDLLNKFAQFDGKRHPWPYMREMARELRASRERIGRDEEALKIGVALFGNEEEQQKWAKDSCRGSDFVRVARAALAASSGTPKEKV